jgi:phosphate starvation-inducible PhoH-like protein
MSKKLRPVSVASKASNDKSPYVHKDHKKLDFDLKIRESIKWTDKQKELFSIIQDKTTKMVYIRGCAGTSKTLSAIYCGLQELNAKKFNELVYIRGAIESADQKLGMLPGEISSKIEPYLIPLMEKLDEFLIEPQIKALVNGEFVSGAPVSFLRGRHMANKYIVVDEAQSLSFSELTTIITRLGEFSKVIICADPMQSDLPSNKQGGFDKMFKIFSDEESKQNGIRTFEFSPEDIVRSKLVKFIVEKLEIYKKNESAGDWKPKEK